MMGRKVKYGWNGAQLNGNTDSTAQKIGEALEDIERRYGKIKPATVVKAASDPEHVLHARFEWDDTAAGEQYRLIQARQLISSVYVKFIDDEAVPSRPVRAYVNMTGPDKEDRAYENVVSVMSDARKRAQLLQRARADMEAFKARFGHLEEFSFLIEVIDKTLGELPAPVVAEAENAKRGTLKRRVAGA